MAKKKTKKRHHPDYEPDVACGNLDHQHPLAMRLINSIFMEIVCAVEEYQEDIEDA